MLKVFVSLEIDKAHTAHITTEHVGVLTVA